jgi:hypothetical protein
LPSLTLSVTLVCSPAVVGVPAGEARLKIIAVGRGERGGWVPYEGERDGERPIATTRSCRKTSEKRESRNGAATARVDSRHSLLGKLTKNSVPCPTPALAAVTLPPCI